MRRKLDLFWHQNFLVSHLGKEQCFISGVKKNLLTRQDSYTWTRLDGFGWEGAALQVMDSQDATFVIEVQTTEKTSLLN